MTPKEDKFNVRINPDTATPEKIADTNFKLVDYMKGIGEDTAAGNIEGLIKNQKTEGNPTKSQQDDRLLAVDRKILSTLEKIQRDMFDEQDTSIKHASRYKANGNLLSGIKKAGQNYSDDSDDSDDSDGSSNLGGYLAGRDKKEKKKGKNKAPKKTSNGKNKTSKKGPKKALVKGAAGMAKGALRMARFLGPIGVAITAGMAIYDGVQGWDDAEGQLGIKGDASTTNKMSSAMGGVISGLSFGLLDSKDTSKGINNLFGGNDIIDKYEKMGIVDHDTFGDSDVLDWKKIGTLNSKEIQEIISIDDFDEPTTKRLNMLKMGADAAQQVPNNQPKTDDYTTVEKVIYKIKKVPTKGTTHNMSVNPDDYSAGDLFVMNGIKEEDFDGLEPNTFSNLKAMGAEYLDIYGEKMQINSAFRSIEEQQKLKDTLGEKAAAPGKSMHNYGLAVDMNTKNADAATSAGLFKKYKFNRPVPGETWHVEPIGIDREAIRSQKVPSTHDNQAVKTASADKDVQEGIVDKNSSNEVLISKNNGSDDIQLSKNNSSDEVQISKNNSSNEVIPTVNRVQREQMIDNSSNNLNAQLAQTNNINHDELAQVIAPMINNTNINTVKPEQQERILSVF